MSDFYFCVTSGHLNARAERIGWRHGAILINYEESDGTSVKRWSTFAVPQRGHPWDQEVAAAVKADIEAAGDSTRCAKSSAAEEDRVSHVSEDF